MYKVIRRFRDKYTGELYLPGDTFKGEETARVNNLIDRGLIESEPSVPSTKKEIIALLDKKGINYDAKSKKDDLLKLLGGD